LATALRGAGQLGQRGADGGAVAFRLDPGEPLELGLAPLGIQLVGLDVGGRLVGREAVDPDHGPRACLDVAVGAVGLVRDEALEVAWRS